jgi:lipoate-protein ligase A
VRTIASRTEEYTARPAGPASVREIGLRAGLLKLCILAYKVRSVNVSPTPLAGSASDDHAISRGLLDRVAAGEIESALRIWTPVPALALSRLDELRPGASAAVAAAERAGLETVRRVSGGHAVVLGAGSFCAGFAEPAATFEGTQERYERLSDAVAAAFAEVGVEAERGELEGEWCPGAWSIRSGSVKLAGLAQRAIKGGAWVEAVIDLAPDPAGRALLAEVYGALELPLARGTLGSVSEVRGAAVTFEELAEPLLTHLGS